MSRLKSRSKLNYNQHRLLCEIGVEIKAGSAFYRLLITFKQPANQKLLKSERKGTEIVPWQGVFSELLLLMRKCGVAVVWLGSLYRC